MRIAHLSDIHALDLRGVRPWRFFNKRLAGGLNLLRHRRNRHPLSILDALCADINRVAPEHAVLTGDLSNLSFPSELQRARAALDRLSLGPRGVTVIPGNHDVYVWEARLGRTFERALQPYALGDDAPPQALPSFPFARVRGEVALIGCSSALPSPPPLADGWLGRRQLAAIEAMLTALRGHFRVLLVHHPPLPQSLDLLRALRDRGALLQVLKRAGCELLLHGHEHRDLRGEVPGRDGPVTIIGAGSGTYNHPDPARRARYNIYHIDGRRLTRVERRVYDPATGAFAAAEAPDGHEGPGSRTLWS